ncbi:MAG: hypothetical protein WCT14_06280 [Treponemataceae bacterium]
MEIPPSDPRNLRRFIFALVSIGVLLSVFFGFSAVRSIVRVATTGLEKGTTDSDAIRGWMTVPYIARVFELSADDLYADIGVPSSESDKKSLLSLNKAFFPGKHGYIVGKVKEAVRRRLEQRTQLPKEKP